MNKSIGERVSIGGRNVKNKERWMFLGFLLFICIGFASDLELSEPLEILRPLINKQWVGGFVDPVSRKTCENIQRFEAIWGGTVIKYTYSISDINTFAEGYFYWNRETKQLEAFILHSSSVVQRGVVTLEEGVITLKGSMIFPDRTFEFRNTFEFKDENTMVDRWFQNAFGPWRAGHVVTLTARNEK